MDAYYSLMKFRIYLYESIMMKSKIFICQNPGFCFKKTSTVFNGWIDCIHDCIDDSTIQMDIDMETDGYRWIEIQIQMDIDTIQMDTGG